MKVIQQTEQNVNCRIMVVDIGYTGVHYMVLLAFCMFHKFFLK